MSKKPFFVIILIIVLISVSGVAPEVQRVKADGTIYIRADGSIDPPTPCIQRDGEVYTFICDIGSIVIQRDNITVDGAGYTLRGSGLAGTGISLHNGRNVTIKNVEIKGFDFAIYFLDSSNNSIMSNNITGNHYGIYFLDSSNNVLRKNTMFNNTWNFFVFGPRLADFLNDVDATNTVDDKPICYWTNDADRSVPLNAGYVALVKCTRITVKNLDLSNNKESILLAYTTNSTIIKNNIEDNIVGIMLRYSSDNIISGNNITNNNFGIFLRDSSNNSMILNDITYNKVGFDLYHSTDNAISGNNITNNNSGVRLDSSSSNRIYNNDFIKNTVQVETSKSVNHWDYGYPDGGNYWSDYQERYPNASELNNSDIWDTPYVIDENNQDNYPIIPEFPSFLILQLFMLATLLASLVFRSQSNR